MKKEDKNLLLTGGLIIAGYFLVIRPLLQSLGLQKTEREKEKETDVNKEIRDQQRKERQTKTDAEWRVIADNIYQSLRFSAIDDDKANAGYQVARVQNNLDFWLLYKFFGNRQEYAFGLPVGGKQDLASFIRGNLSKSAIAQINNNYRSKGIKFQY